MAFLNRSFGWRTRTARGLMLAVATAAAAHAASPIVTTQQVYAAFTVNLTRFVLWPPRSFPRPDSPLVIGTFPRDGMTNELERAARGERVDSHPLQVLRLRSMDDLQKCHLVYVSAQNPRTLAILDRCARKPILLVGDGAGFLQLGGHVRFVAEPPHARLRLSIENLKASGLECRPQLLRLATQ